VTHYGKVTREEIARRNYTEGTTRAYVDPERARRFEKEGHGGPGPRGPVAGAPGSSCPAAAMCAISD